MLPPKMGAGVLGSRLGGDQAFFSSFFSSDFSFVSAATATLQAVAGSGLYTIEAKAVIV